MIGRAVETSRAAGGAGIAVAIALVLTLSGCMQEVPIVSNDPGNKTTNMTLEEQREWVGQQLDAAIDASGVTDGWFKTRVTLPWSDAQKDRDGVLNMLYPRDCGAGGRLTVTLNNRSVEDYDPYAAADRVRAFWESEGWPVSDILSYESDPYFHAVGEAGEMMALMASEIGLSLEVVTACSVHDTVTNWAFQGEEKNEFAEELKRRGEGAQE